MVKYAVPATPPILLADLAVVEQKAAVAAPALGPVPLAILFALLDCVLIPHAGPKSDSFSGK